MKTVITKIIAVLILFVFATPVFADISSSNYTIVNPIFSGGGGSAQSSSYAIQDGVIDNFTKADLSSSNYQAQGFIGALGVERIAAISSITPGDYAHFYTDESVSFAVSATTPDGDTLQYKAYQDGTLKDGPQESNVLGWSLSTSDIGRHTVAIQTVDPHGTVSADQSIYVYRRPLK